MVTYLASRLPYLKKGSHVLIEGQPTAEQKLDKSRNGRPKIWTSQDGQPHADHECKVLELRMLGGSRKADGQDGGSDKNGGAGAAPAGDDQDFPF
jgi:single-stranded DNA-binding protein